jgi:hypothetical protein
MLVDLPQISQLNLNQYEARHYSPETTSHCKPSSTAAASASLLPSQAQECVLEKAIMDKKSPALLARCGIEFGNLPDRW